MRHKLFGALSFLFGILVALTPRYILPVCEFHGKSKMACSYTGQAELFIGLFLVAISIGTFLSKSLDAFKWLMFVAFFAGISVILIPEVLGYCLNPQMPCNYGTVPILRLWGLSIIILSFVGFLISRRTAT